MLAHTIFALIEDNKVQNTIICDYYHTADALAKNILGPEAFAVEITQIPTAIGHSYENGIFKDLDGNIVTPLPTSEQEVENLKVENNTLQSAVTELTVYSAMQEDRISIQENAITELSTLISGGM